MDPTQIRTRILNIYDDSLNDIFEKFDAFAKREMLSDTEMLELVRQELGGEVADPYQEWMEAD